MWKREKKKKKNSGRGLCLTHVGGHVVNETWLEFEIAGVKVAIAKKIKVRVFFFLLGSYPLVGRHVVKHG